MPKNQSRSYEESSRLPRIPRSQDGEILGFVTEIYGGEHMAVKATNGTTYMGTIRGKIKKRMWCRAGDVVILSPWVGMSDPKGDKKPNAHIIWRYTKPQLNWLQSHNYLTDEFMLDMQNI
jgi:translation initiation factor 1A